jgi:chromosome segregation ATPase
MRFEEAMMATTPAEIHIEARLARLESDVGHIRSDLSEVKIDVRVLRDKIDLVDSRAADRTEHATSNLEKSFDEFESRIGVRFDEFESRLGQRIDDSNTRLDGTNKRIDESNARIDRLEAKLDGVKDSLHSATIWALFLYVTLAAGMLTTIARAFRWI